MNRSRLPFFGVMLLLALAIGGCMSSPAPGASQPTAISIPAALVSFDVGAPLNRPADALFIPAQLTYSTAQERREFTVVLEQNSWRVAGSTEPFGEIPAPTPDPATQEWRSALSADINGDGATEQISYRTGRARVNTPVGFSDPSIATVMIAEEVIVKQEASPGGRTLLYLNPIALSVSSVDDFCSFLRCDMALRYKIASLTPR